MTAEERDDLVERGRELASQREDLVAAGADPSQLEVPIAPGDDRHPEEYCHRCGGRNISWYTPGGVWDPVMRPIPGGEWKWNEIICPLCFVDLAGGEGTWALLPRGLDGEAWTSADERAAIAQRARAAEGDRIGAAFSAEDKRLYAKCDELYARAEAAEAKVRRLSTRIAAITTADDQAVLAIARVEAWCGQQDALSKGESLTTAAIRAALAGDAR